MERPKKGPAEQLAFSVPVVDQMLRGLPSPIRQIVRAFYREPVLEPDALEAQLGELSEHLETQAPHTEFMDIELARKLVRRCLALVNGLDHDTPEEHRRLIQTAVRYLILEEDSEGDTTSPIGFDDDALVIELVAKAVGREDVLRIE